MLGWHISVFRQADGGASPAAVTAPVSARLAVWQTDWKGLDWVDGLVKEQRAVDLGGDGCPNQYTARAEVLLPFIIGGPPGARAAWAREPGDMVTGKWEGKTVIDRDAIAQCQMDEWLLIEAWDES